jgi:hypothetical protein
MSQDLSSRRGVTKSLIVADFLYLEPAAKSQKTFVETSGSR